MTPVALPRPAALPAFDAWCHALLRRLAGGNATALPPDMDDWQLRDLDLTRPFAGPCHPTFFWLP